MRLTLPSGTRFPEVQVVVYDEADRGFVHDPSRPSHRESDAEDAWRRVRAFLSELGG